MAQSRITLVVHTVQKQLTYPAWVERQKILSVSRIPRFCCCRIPNSVSVSNYWKHIPNDHTPHHIQWLQIRITYQHNFFVFVSFLVWWFFLRISIFYYYFHGTHIEGTFIQLGRYIVSLIFISLFVLRFVVLLSHYVTVENTKWKINLRFQSATWKYYKRAKNLAEEFLRAKQLSHRNCPRSNTHNFHNILIDFTILLWFNSIWPYNQ